MNQQILRDRAKMVKAIGEITYKEIATDLLEMRAGSFYNFLCGDAQLSYRRARLLEDYINSMID